MYNPDIFWGRCCRRSCFGVTLAYSDFWLLASGFRRLQDGTADKAVFYAYRLKWVITLITAFITSSASLSVIEG